MELVTGGLSYGVYSNLAKVFYSQGIGWAHATGIIRQYLPKFSGSEFATAYYRNYQTNKQRDYISKMNDNDVIPPNLMIERSLSEPVEYRYIGEFTYIDNLTGVEKSEYKSYYTNDLLSPSQAEDFLRDAFDIEKYESCDQLTDVSLVNVEHNEGWGDF